MSFCYSSEKQRRIAQFADALAPMHHRTVTIVKDCCFAIIEEPFDCHSESPNLEATVQLESVLASPAFGSMDLGINSFSKSDKNGHSTSYENIVPKRFIQFIFLEKHFEMDLPSPMLDLSEARAILQTLDGFYFLGERGDFEKHSNTIHRFRPLRKAYVHGDVHSAAEDIAAIFFNLWRFPIDSILHLSTFGGRFCWDTGKSLQYSP